MKIRGALRAPYSNLVYFSQVEFNVPVNVESISIYETYHAGAVVKVSLRHPSGAWVPVWTGNAQNIGSSRKFQPQLQVQSPLLITRHDAVTRISAYDSTAFIWKLCCHWLKCLCQRHAVPDMHRFPLDARIRIACARMWCKCERIRMHAYAHISAHATRITFPRMRISSQVFKKP